jgi:PhnB protein
MARLNPYLSFEGNCREAMNFYKEALDGELFLQTVGEMPAMAAKMPPHMQNSVLHSTLTSGDMVIMASDLNRNKAIEGNTIGIIINCETEEELNIFFSKLSSGGKVVEPLTDMPWGGRYGAIIDQFGKQWEFNLPLGSQA